VTDFLAVPLEGVTVRCTECPGRPVLPTRCDTIDFDRCVRCQGKHRYLSKPHPDDHLCRWCRSECPGCGAPTPRGTDEPGRLCSSCRGRCRICARPVPERPAQEPTAITPRKQKGGPRRQKKQGPRLLIPSLALSDVCDGCLSRESRDPVHTVLKALPEPVVRACRGSLPAYLLAAIRTELAYRTPAQLAERIERRWWNRWSNQPIRSNPAVKAPGHSPDHVAYWLVAPTDCTARCEDGFQAHDTALPCPACRREPVPEPKPTPATSDHAAACAAAIRAQLHSRPGQASRRPAYTPKTDAETAAFDQAVEAARARQSKRTGPQEELPPERDAEDLDRSVILQRRLERHDPVHAAALARANADRAAGTKAIPNLPSARPGGSTEAADELSEPHT
jgi:hypothetical protein